MRNLFCLLYVLTMILILSACTAAGNKEALADRSDPVTVEEAKALIQSSNIAPGPSGDQGYKLVEITSDDVWETTGCQIFKIIDGSSYESFLIKGRKAIHIGLGFGGFGITSIVPYDVNRDGTTDLVYAYSFGSGIHRSVISWFDLSSLSEHSVMDETFDEFREDDLILKTENGSLNVYRITGTGNKIDSLCTYPTEDDLRDMTLEEGGNLVWQDGELYNKKLIITTSGYENNENTRE